MSSKSIRFGRARVAATALTLIVAAWTGGPVAAPAIAEPGSSFTAAITAARGASSCGPLRYDPTLQRAADIVNRSTESYSAMTDVVTPADSPPQPMPIIKDLGSAANKATLLQGAAHTEGDAIKGAVVQGFAKIPDCTYTDFGTSTVHSEATGYSMVVAVLAGP